MIKTKSRILLVDDYPSVVTATRHKLLQKGYEVITAQNGKDALELAQTEYPDLIITDIDMPVLDGYELCEKIKNDSRLHKIPVILITSLVTTESLMKGIEAGADNYLTKPFDDETLFNKVEELLTNPPDIEAKAQKVPVNIDGKTYSVRKDFPHLIKLLVSTYKNTLAQNLELTRIQNKLNEANKELELTKKEHEELIQNIFPEKVAESLIAYGNFAPERHNDVTIMFTDFDGFSKVVPRLSPEKLVDSLSFYFDKFDDIAGQHNLIKIKTIGDSYMAAGGLPEENNTHPVDTILAALKLIQFVGRLENKLEDESTPYWPVRIGIHTGRAVVGVIGKARFAYDLWGETVNQAARMEQNSGNNCINISQSTYDRVKNFFECEPRGKIEAKNIGNVPMYFVKRIKPDLSEDDEGIFPNRLFIRSYNQMARQGNSSN